MFGEIFKNPDFQPDLLKIYPCAVLKESPLYSWWKKGKYQPYSEKTLIDLIKKIKKKIPYYVRIQRITRDIPADSIVAGPAKISNLRQIITREAEKEGWHCKCIRCREIREDYDPREKPYLYREDYESAGGREIFLSFETKKRNKLYSLLRLRIPSFVSQTKKNKSYLTRALKSKLPFPVLKNAALIREIHTYGQLQSLRSHDSLIAVQHKGLGKTLLKKAEKIAKQDFGLSKIAVISGIGARNYFRKQGYQLKETYMVKEI